MAKKISYESEPIQDIVKCLVNFSEYLSDPPEDAEINPERDIVTLRFVLDSPKSRTEAILKLLFRETKYKKPAGPKGFVEHDTELALKMIEEMESSNKTLDALLDEYVDLAQAMDEQTSPESIRERLVKTYRKVKKENQFYDYGDMAGKGFENFPDIESDLRVLMPFLKKYKKELINLLNEV